MRLTDQKPRWVPVEYAGKDRAPCYLAFQCPCEPGCECVIAVAFTPDLEGNETPANLKPWKREGGSTFEDLTLSPSIWLHADDYVSEGRAAPHQGWHGFLRNGELQTC